VESTTKEVARDRHQTADGMNLYRILIKKGKRGEKRSLYTRNRGATVGRQARLSGGLKYGAKM